MLVYARGRECKYCMCVLCVSSKIARCSENGTDGTA